MQKLCLRRNRTTIVAEPLKGKVVKNRTVNFHQRFAAAPFEILTDRNSVTFLEKTLDRRIAVRKEIIVIDKSGQKRNQPFNVRFVVLMFRLPVQLFAQIARFDQSSVKHIKMTRKLSGSICWKHWPGFKTKGDADNG